MLCVCGGGGGGAGGGGGLRSSKIVMIELLPTCVDRNTYTVRQVMSYQSLRCSLFSHCAPKQTEYSLEAGMIHCTMDIIVMSSLVKRHCRPFSTATTMRLYGLAASVVYHASEIKVIDTLHAEAESFAVFVILEIQEVLPLTDRQKGLHR